MKNFKFKIISLAFSLFALSQAVFAEAPAGYYSAAEGKNKAALLKSLHSIIGDHTTISYKGIWSVFKESDVTKEGYIWDMYSTVKWTPGADQCGQYSGVGVCYNREHSFPKSWFSDASPMFSDAFHLYPTDGYVNSKRGNHPFGECAGGQTWAKALGRLGNSTFPGYSGIVFEPDDMYKGDFARTYFYMAACYNDRIAGWNSDMLAHNNYPCYKEWAVNLLLKWHRQDPVSQKEIDRNEVVYRHQKNRNPFIDNPELAEYIWGSKKNEGWVPGGVITPMIVTPVEGSKFDMGYTTINRRLAYTIKVKGQGMSEDLQVSFADNAHFSASKTLLAPADVNSVAGASFEVYFLSAESNTYSTVLTLENSDVKRDITIVASAVSGIPAQPATQVTTDGFTANWTNVSGQAEYNFTVYGADASSVLAGYPVKVSSSAQTYDVRGLDYSTDYYYTLSMTDGSMLSNKVKVTTLAPTPVIELVAPADGVKFVCAPGEKVEPLQVQVYTEYITEDVTVKVTGPFVVSSDKTNWSNTLTVDAQGESFYVQPESTEVEGDFAGNISAFTESVDGAEIDVVAYIAAPRTFVEDFERVEIGGYWTSNVQGSACLWTFNDVGVWEDSNSKGSKSARFGKKATSSIVMAEDKHNGAGTISFYAAYWDSAVELEVSYSIDGGNSWTLLKKILVENSLLEYYSIDAGIKGSVRFKIEQTSGKRLNIDDITISDFAGSSVGVNTSLSSWDAYPVDGGIVVECAKDEVVEVYSLDGALVHRSNIAAPKAKIALSAGAYIVTLDDYRGCKVIVKQ